MTPLEGFAVVMAAAVVFGALLKLVDLFLEEAVRADWRFTPKRRS